MDDKDRKLLTEWLGECWHEAPYNVPATDVVYRCVKCKTAVYPASGFRTFTEDKDFFACFNRLVELGEWEKFIGYCKYTFVAICKYYVDAGDYEKWLLSRTDTGHYRLCVLAVEWIRRER
jgi:hypothetical protein